MEELKKIYPQDILQYANILNRFKRLTETNPREAYRLSIDALVVYDRWSYIKLEIKKNLKRGEKAELKDRLKEMCDFLKEVAVISRMVWKNSVDDMRINRGG